MDAAQVRDETVSQIIAAGGTILSTTPLAHPDTPQVVVAWRITAGAVDAGVMDALAEIRAETETTLHGLVPWIPEEVEDAPIDDA